VEGQRMKDKERGDAGAGTLVVPVPVRDEAYGAGWTV
jgi:hypothetical protein